MEYELFDELTSRIRTLAKVAVGRVELDVGSFDFALLNRLGDVTVTLVNLLALECVASFELDFSVDFFNVSDSFAGVSCLGASHRLV